MTDAYNKQFHFVVHATFDKDNPGLVNWEIDTETRLPDGVIYDMDLDEWVYPFRYHADSDYIDEQFERLEDTLKVALSQLSKRGLIRWTSI